MLIGRCFGSVDKVHNSVALATVHGGAETVEDDILRFFFEDLSNLHAASGGGEEGLRVR